MTRTTAGMREGAWAVESMAPINNQTAAAAAISRTKFIPL
jgi:hypothetical protein